MTIDKAIRILERYYFHHRDVVVADLIEAEKLSIEALKRVKEAREQHLVRNDSPLPGETEE